MRPAAAVGRLLTVVAATAYIIAPSAAWAQGTHAPTPPAPPATGGPPQQPPPQGPGQIQGVVLSAATGQPIASASVMVRAASDPSPGSGQASSASSAGQAAALAGGALTRADGSFRIAGLRPGRYVVLARSLGFAPVTRGSVTITAEQPAVNLGRLALTVVAARLSEVNVQAERQAATLAPDRNSYTVKDMPAASGGTAVDVLRNVPAVEVDGDNKVSLRGNENVVVQLNGRASPLRGEQLGNFLAQLPATMVSKVEVAPNPSAKDDPEGLAGIINIVMKQQADLGTSGGLTAGGGSTGQANLSGNLGRQEGRWTLFGSYGYMRDRRTVQGYTTRENRYATPLTYLDSDIDGTMWPESHSVTTTAEYKPRERDVLSSNLVVNRRIFERDSYSFYRDRDAGGTLTGRSTQLTNQDLRDLTIDHALTYKHTVDPQRNAFSAELRFNQGRNHNGVMFTEETLLPDGTWAGAAPGVETNDTRERTNSWIVQGDYTRALGADTKLETGVKGTLRRMDSDFDVAQLSATSGAYEPDLARSNTFAFREQVQAAYGVLSRHAGKFDLQGGLRLEHADTRFDLATTGERYDNDYNSVFPSALASYNLSEQRQLKLSYSKRINRPATQQLNPFGFREDALNVFKGNPRLQPEYTHAFELGYQQSLGKGSLQLTPFYRRTLNAVRHIGTVDENGVSTVSFENVATVNSYGADANVTVKLGRLSGFGGASAFEQVVDADNVGSGLSNRSFAWSVRGNATVKLTPALEVQGFAMYRSPTRIEQGRFRSFTLTNLAIKQKLRGDKSSLTLRVMDPFGTMGWGIRASDGRVAQLLERQFGARGAFLSYNYTFGQQPKIRARPQEAEAPQGGPGIGPG